MSEPVAVFQGPSPQIRRVPIDRPWVWLAAGWNDLWAAPASGLVWGAGAVAAGWASIALLLWFEQPWLVLPLSAGFFFVGPFMAVGLYETSRRLGAGLPVDGRATLGAWRRNPDQIALMGVVLLLLHLAWMRIAQLLFALFQGSGVPSWDRFTDVLWHSARSLPFLAAGVAIGAVLAALAFVIGAFSLPFLLDRRHSNVFEAIATSVAAVRLNPRPMLLWAGLIVMLVAMAMVPGLLGLVVVLPVVAHATWHAYRDVVVFEPAPPSGEATAAASP